MLVIFENETKVILPQLLLTQLKEYLQTAGFQKESGGIILGSKKAHQPTYIIKELTFPNKIDRRFPRAFIRSKKKANEAIVHAWQNSSECINYLGEWHTHNELKPKKSRTDKDLIRKLLQDNCLPYGIILILIIGNNKFGNLTMVDKAAKAIKEVDFIWQD